MAFPPACSRRGRGLRWLALAPLVAGACASASPDIDGGVTTQASGTTTTGESTESSTTEVSTETGTDPEPPPVTCDIYEQDCLPGEKCVPYSPSADPAELSGHICVPVLGDTPVGEPCSFDGWATPTDDCDADGLCLAGPDGAGICQAFCAGEPGGDGPWCDPGSSCYGFGSAIGVCTLSCDPLLQDCQDGACYLTGSLDYQAGYYDFQCLPVFDPGAPAGPCELANDCAPGSVCLEGAVIPGCASARCCTPLCDLAEPNCAALPNSECQPSVEEGQGWGLEPGVCVIPGS